MVTINFEREFFKTAKGLEKYSEVREQFLKKINEKAYDWISDKLRVRINGLEDDLREK